MGASGDGDGGAGLPLESCLAAALGAAREAGEVIGSAFREAKKVEVKGSSLADLVTETDKQCEALIRKRLNEAFPSFAFIGEEETAEAMKEGGTAGCAERAAPVLELEDGPTWMVDPLDGTTNFVHGFPFSCVSIALVVSRRPVVGVVHNPILGETYTAIRGKGAFLNGVRCSCSGERELEKALMATEVGTTRDPETVDAVTSRLKVLVMHARSVRACGAAAITLPDVSLRRDAPRKQFAGRARGPWTARGSGAKVC